MRRALVPGGRLAVSTWRSDEELPVLLELRRIAERFVGPISDRRHSFGEARPLEALLQSAGFLDVRLKTVSRTIRFDEGPVFVRLNAMALVGMSAQSKGMTDDRRREIVEAIARDSAAVVESDTGAAGFSFELSATVATARA
jgi:hypothetical protein